MKKIGVLYMDGTFFNDEAAKTMGMPAIAGVVIKNRRAVTGKLTEAGKAWKKKVVAWFMKHYGVEVKLRWSRYAGCSMCPCSPGFKIMVDVNNIFGPLKLRQWSSTYKKVRTYENEHNIWINSNNLVDCRFPEVPILRELVTAVQA